MKINFNLYKYNNTFTSNNVKDIEPGSVEYSNPHFLELEKAEAKAKIAKYIEESEIAEVLKPKNKNVFTKLENLVIKGIKKFKK